MLPLIALTADRPPELRGIGAGQTIDQVKLYGAAVRWFSEVGTHEADDDGLLHFRSVACRALAAARSEPARPRCTSTSLGASRWPRSRSRATSPRPTHWRSKAARAPAERRGRRIDREPAAPARRARRAHRRCNRRGHRRRPATRRGACATARRTWRPEPRAFRSSPSRPRSFAGDHTTAPRS